MSILLIGGGSMGRAMLGGWLAAGEDRIAVIDPAPSPELQSMIDGSRVTLGLADLPPPLTVVMAVKPQKLDAIAPDYAHLTGPDVMFLSVVAGKTLARLAAHLGADAAIIRSMPNLAAQVGRGVSALIANDRARPDQRRRAQSLLEAVGAIEWVTDEGQIDIVTAVSGSGPAYVFFLVEALADAGVACGLDPAMAMRLARATIMGAGEVLHRNPADAADLRKAVTSPAGTTAAALEVLMGPEGMRPLLARAVAAAAERSRQLAD